MDKINLSYIKIMIILECSAEDGLLDGKGSMEINYGKVSTNNYLMHHLFSMLLKVYLKILLTLFTLITLI